MPAVPVLVAEGAFNRSVRDQINDSFQAVGLDHTPGSVYYVHGDLGNDNNDGKAWGANRALRTMKKAFSKLVSGDIVYFAGNIREQIDTPVGVFDVKVIGAGNLPRHADQHSTNGGYSGSTWKGPASAAATTPLVRVRQQGWKFINILFAPPSDSSAIRLFRDAGAADAERDASHAHIIGCRFAGGQDGVEFHGQPNFVRIENCHFHQQTGTSIKNTVGAGVGTNYNTLIRGNRFADNANAIISPLTESMVVGNYMGRFTTKCIDLTNGGGNNVIYDNFLWGTYSIAGGYIRSAASDDWGGNWNSGVAILTAADPA